MRILSERDVFPLRHGRMDAAADGLKRIEGVVLSENSRMLQMAREIGFKVKHSDETGISVAILDLGQHRR